MSSAGQKWRSRVGRLENFGVCHGSRGAKVALSRGTFCNFWQFWHPCAVRGFGGKVALAQIGARNGHFLIKDLLAGAPELALARLGLEMVIFLLRSY